jgi:hypothetical protein
MFSLGQLIFGGFFNRFGDDGVSYRKDISTHKQFYKL